VVAAALASNAPAPALAAGEASARRTPLVAAIERALPSVVSITSEKRAASNSRWPYSPEENRRPRVNGMGTGVILDERGFIITNQHVVHEVDDLRVMFSDGTTYPAKVIQQDAGMDLALLKVDAGKPLKAIRIGNSDDLMLGEQVITIGNAFGYENTTSVGVIGALHRNVRLADDQNYRNLIQTDAAINPGNSGGPLVNVDGELIGINVATRAGAQGIGFALPIDDVKRVALEMLSTRKLAGTWHGLVTGEEKESDARVVKVAKVEEGSPAEQAGVKGGDRVATVNDLEVVTPLDIERALLGIRPGETARVGVVRDGQPQQIVMTIQGVGTIPVDSSERLWQVLGMKAVRVPAQYVTPASEKLRGGLYIQEVLAGGAAEQAFLRKGDILVGMHVDGNDWETIKPENVLFILKQTGQASDPLIRYYIVRKNVIHQGQLDIATVPNMDTILR
jgi:serine protease Do